MGGLVTKVLTDVGEAAGKDLIDGFKAWASEEGAQNWYRSFKGVLGKSPIGKSMADFLEYKLEPEVKRTAQTYATQKIKAGIKPDVAYIDAGKEAWHDVRKAYLGKNDEAVIKFINTVRKQEGLSRAQNLADGLSIYFHDSSSHWRKTRVPGLIGTNLKGKPMNLAETGLRSKAPYVDHSQFEMAMKSMMGWMYTPLIAIPHLSQVGNIVLNEGISSTAKAMADYTKALSNQGGSPYLFFQDLIDSGALFDEFKYQAIKDAQGGGLARELFHHPGFNWVRRQEITLAALSAKHSALNAVEKLTRDPADKWASYTLNRLGIKPQKVLQQGGKLIDEDIQSAMYQGANQAIFLRSELYTPIGWEANPALRLAAQYKHFAFRQGKFLGAAFKGAWKAGGPAQFAKTVAIWGTLFPAFGELVHSMEQAAQGDNPFHRDKQGTDEYFDAMGHAAGLGIYHSLFRAGMWNYGRGFLEGPLFSTAEDIFLGIPTHLLKGTKYYIEGEEDKGIKQYKAAARVAVAKMGIPGRVVATQMKEKKEAELK